MAMFNLSEEQSEDISNLTATRNNSSQRFSSSNEGSVTSALLQEYRDELDEFYVIMVDFKSMDVSEVLEMLASMTSRASQMRLNMNRKESSVNNQFRIKEIDPFISECDRQFKVWSRLLSVHMMDWEMSRKAT